MIVGISTCKGRLEHIKTTSYSFVNSIKESTAKYLLVDYACPEKTGSWVKDNFQNNINVQSIILNPPSPKFHKTIALNTGAKYAIANMKAEYLLFFDADTIIKDGFIEKIIPILSEDKFIFVNPSRETKDLTGLIIIHRKLFRESGGYEESFRDWGAEDLEFRLRLYAKHKKSFDLINGDYLDSIPHDNELRTKFYKEKDPDISNKKNIQRMRKMFSLYRGDDLEQWKKLQDGYNIGKILGLF